MRPRSLRLRLLALAFATIAAALAVSGLGLYLLFEDHVERRVDAELDVHLNQLAGSITVTADGAIEVVPPPADPRFTQPLGGLYWQIRDAASGEELRSRSLWDEALALPRDELGETGVHRHVLPGPAGQRVIVRERAIAYPEADGTGRRALRIAVAIDAAEVAAAARAFAVALVPSLAVLGAALLLAAWLQVRIGLRPLEAIRGEIGAVRSGATRRLGAGFPAEVMPLAREVDQLLDEQDRALERARTGAADLAHGLKTPLTVLGADARRLRERGEDEIATRIEELVEAMRRHIDRALARARLHPTGRAATEIAPLVERLIALVRKSPRGETLAWESRLEPGLRAAIDRDDLAELVGNLLDNAVRWSRGRVRVSSAQAAGGIRMVIEDDGPGIPPEARAAVTGRGIGNTGDGTGLGLAIVSDILDASGGRLELAESDLGGLRATVEVPPAATAADHVPAARPVA